MVCFLRGLGHRGNSAAARAGHRDPSCLWRRTSIFLFKVVRRQSLRSPFQNNHLGCFVHCVRIPFIFSQSKNGTPFGVPSCFGGERGIRTLVRLLSNAFRVRPVMTASISLRVFLALYCSYSTSEIGENSRRELSY